MSSVNFVAQEASEEIFKRVSCFCAECYSEFEIGDTIHYDMKEYRYLCRVCFEKINTQHQQELREEPLEDSSNLFG